MLSSVAVAGDYAGSDPHLLETEEGVSGLAIANKGGFVEVHLTRFHSAGSAEWVVGKDPKQPSAEHN